ncbi:SpoIIE family protein phosphatase [uncultured Oscillibacter sp.]|uniref:SpoIIE family protein phosphatase n=1 Tax=uncultured Oscillibacter sp. TaxID=876091 RepID=UPI001F9DF85D|nr:SpoIIE family protein phosphatase [uncultured Oscillibacter sp.]HJB31367.1 SpoIIE family protein phosphatase [Candidatus Oscillibacter excrementavium]
MEYRELIRGRQQAARPLAWGIRFFLTAALTASQTPGDYAPFALGCVAACGPGAEGISALLGAGVGAVLFLDFAGALPFLAAAILIFTTAAAFQGLKLLDGPWFHPLAGAGLFLAVSGIYVLQSLSPLRNLAPCLAGTVLVGLSAWYYQPLLQAGQERLEPDSLLFLTGSILLALVDVELAGLSIGRALLCLLLVYTAYQRGAMTGAAAGLGAGLAADFCSGTGGVLFGAAYGLAGLLAGSRSGGRRIWAALAFWGAAVLAALPAGLATPLLPEAAVGSALFLLLPGRVFGGKRVKQRAAAEFPAALEGMRAQLTRMAAALRDLYDSMGRSAPVSTEENPAVIFDRAAEKVCRGCALCELCWQREYTGTFNALNDATPFLLERGRALAKDFPGYFADRCIHLPDFLTAVNGELSAFLLRRQYRRQLEETRRSAKGQYAQLSDLLTATAAGLGEVRATASQAAAACRIGAALRPKEGETVCGDTVVSFRTESGLLCLLLADGMGSGEAARRESALTCRLLEQFLEAGIEPEAAMKTLNSAMALRGADTGSFTTIDLLTCRPDTGELAFYKYGAAPSYLKKGGTVRRITGGSLPAGLRGGAAVPDVTRATLEPGSFAVMISDGVADPGRDEWLQNLLAGWEGEDPQTLAGLILSESIRRENLQDDCGIQVLYLPRPDGVKKV